MWAVAWLFCLSIASSMGASSHANPSSAEAIQLPAKDNIQLVYLRDNVVMHYISATGEYELYPLVTNHPSLKSKCPTLAIDPIYKGILPLKFFKATPFGEGSVLFVNPRRGSYSVWRCESLRSKPSEDVSAPCSFAYSGRWGAAIGSAEMVTIGNNTIVLKHDTGILSVFSSHIQDSVESISFGSESQARGGLFSSIPIVDSYRPELKGHRLLGIGNNYVLEYNTFTAEYRVWVFDEARHALVGPGARGQLPNHLPLQLIWMGEDRLASVNEDLSYVFLRIDTSYLVHPAPLPMTAIGRSDFDNRPCDYSSCEACTSDPDCGWCSSQNRCLAGGLEEPCNLGNGNKCESWMLDYCAASSCISRITRSNCISDGVCGWCESSSLCFHQINGTVQHHVCDGVLSLRH